MIARLVYGTRFIGDVV